MNAKRSNPVRTAIAGLAPLLCAATALADDAAELEAVRNKVAETFEVIEPEHVNPSPVDGWYTIQKGSIVAYISADGRYLLQGDLIDLDENINLSDATRNDARLEVLADIEEDDAIVFSPASPKYTVNVFTDVDCTYCRRLHSQIEEYMALGIEIRYFLYPRNGPASKAWNTSEEVWCSRDRKHALTLAKLDRSFPTSTDCDASMVSEHYVMGQHVGLSGTPAILFEDGELVPGYMPPQQLKARLESKYPEE